MLSHDGRLQELCGGDDDSMQAKAAALWERLAGGSDGAGGGDKAPPAASAPKALATPMSLGEAVQVQHIRLTPASKALVFQPP